MDKRLDDSIKKAVQVLIHAGAREVYLFGSCTTTTVRDNSDVDLAVSGLPPRMFFRAMSRAVAVLDRPMDLVDLDETNPFTQFLKAEGLLRRVG